VVLRLTLKSPRIMVCSDADNGWSRCKSFTNTKTLDEGERYNNTILIDLKDVCILISTRKNCFRYLKLMFPLKNNYVTLRSKVQVPRRLLWYVIHCLMVMHPHTKYHWPIWKDKKVMVRTSFAEKKRKRRKKKKSD
jgi:hypothetical protein